MNIIADTHTHTVASGHAYSTVTENLQEAARQGLQFLACTDHTGKMPGAPHEFYFNNLGSLPEQMFGVWLIRGCEVNIQSETGELDLPDRVLRRLDWVIASMHIPVFPPSSQEKHLQTWLAVAENPNVDVIGHCGDERYRFDYEAGIRKFKETGKIVEINSHSFSFRPNSPENCREIALLCKKYGVRIAVSSDAHFHKQIGEFSEALQMLWEIAFPEELIVNADGRRFAEIIKQNSGRQFPKKRTHEQPIGE